MEPLKSEDRRLREECKEVSISELRTKALQADIEELLAIVYGKNNKGEKRNISKPMTVGLSANQIGIMKRISVVDLAVGHTTFNDIHVLINPTITWHSKTFRIHREGCVNTPGINGVVKRYREVIVEALDRSGNKLTIRAKGWPATLLQHEIDHLQGYLFVDRLEDPTKAHVVESGGMNEYRKKWREWDAFVDVTPLLRENISSVA